MPQRPPRQRLSSNALLGSLSKRAGRPIPSRELERLCEPVLQEFSQLGCRLELRDRLQFLER